MTRFPHHMTLELTAKCNFRCPYCYCVWHERPELAKPELDAAGWKRVLDKCAADGVDEILFTGGEALLRKDLFEIIDYARHAMPEARLSLFTNASRLDERLLRKFKRRRVHLATSLQGLRTYAEMTGTRRSFKRLLAVVARAAELKWPIAVSITVTRANMSETADIFAAAVITRGEWESVKESIRSLPDGRVPYTFCDEFICECRTDLPDALREKWRDPNHKPCPAGRDFGTIGPNGRYRNCLHSL